MKDIRHGLRAKCFEKCLLNFNGTRYQGILGNISISGALVNLKEEFPDMHAGDFCGLHLCNDLNVCPREYSCQVARVAEVEVGLRFVHSC